MKRGNSKSEIDEAAVNNASIDQAANNDGVDTAKTNGVDAINNVQPDLLRKTKQKQRLIKRRK